jgi:hypothetical protein
MYLLFPCINGLIGTWSLSIFSLVNISAGNFGINEWYIKLSSFPGFILNNTAGTIQLASTLIDPMIQNILTRIEESRNYVG